MRSLLRYCATLVLATAACAVLVAQPARASMGLSTLPGPAEDQRTTVFYPSDSPPANVQRGVFRFEAAVKGSPIPGNRRLIVISHGSGGSPWSMVDLARVLVDAGFVVAMPDHEGDNWHDHRKVGPDSWKLRPTEVSQAIDAVARDAQLGPLLDTRQVGVYGMSAGGLTALAMAGGRWSPGNFKRHCVDHMQDDFAACVGLLTQLRGNFLDPVKLQVARWVHRLRFDDDTWQAHTDPRVKAAVANVPMAAPFDMDSLARPPIPLGLVTAGQDQWLVPRFHSDRVLAACTSCETIASLPQAGHASLLSPWPAELTAEFNPLMVRLMTDPPGFDRQVLPGVYDKIAAFFTRHLLAPATAGQ